MNVFGIHPLAIVGGVIRRENFMAKRRKKKTRLERERAKKKRYIKTKEKQGYRFSEEFKTKITSFKTVASFQRWTPQKLLSKATAISQITGEIISGTEAQKERRSLASKRGWETRRTREYQKEHFEEPIYTPPEPYTQEWYYHYSSAEPDEDAYDYSETEYNDWYYDPVYEGKLIKYRLDAIVDAYKPRLGAFLLEGLIRKEEIEFGDKFYRALAMLDEDIIKEATELAQYESSDGDKAIAKYNSIISMIKGTFSTELEAKEVGEAMDEFEDGEEYEV